MFQIRLPLTGHKTEVLSVRENKHVNMHYTCTTIDADTVPARFYPRILRSLDMSTDNYCFKGTCHSTTNTWVEEEDENISIAVPGTRTPRQNLSGMRRNHSEESFAFIPESNKCVGLTNTLAKSKSLTDFSNATSDMSAQQHFYFIMRRKKLAM